VCNTAFIIHHAKDSKRSKKVLKQRKARCCLKKIRKWKAHDVDEFANNSEVNMVGLEQNFGQELLAIEKDLFEDNTDEEEVVNKKISYRDDNCNKPAIIASKKSKLLYEVPLLKMKILNEAGDCIREVDAMLDTGAQVSIIEQQLIIDLVWDVERTSLFISGIKGPDRKVKSSCACFGLVKLPDANTTVIQMFYVMPKLNVPILLGNDKKVCFERTLLANSWCGDEKIERL